MECITELLARTSPENATPIGSKGYTDNSFEPVHKLRKTFDHCLFFRTICNTTSHTLGSNNLVAGLCGVEQATPAQLGQWLRCHAEKVR